MHGKIVGVWSEMRREIWTKLARRKDAPKDLFCELYRELAGAFHTALDVNTLAEIIDDSKWARSAFLRTKAEELRCEIAGIEFLEHAHQIIVDFGVNKLVEKYFELIENFIEKYSLHYELRCPFTFHPTLPGIFAHLIRNLKKVTDCNPNLGMRMREFEHAIRGLRADQTPGHIMTCIQKQGNLLESIGQQLPNVNVSTLSEIYDEVKFWPHDKLKEAAKNLYGFTCNYPGIRHGGSPQNSLREIEMRDLVAVSVLLSGFIPYLTDLPDSKNIYWKA
ncbi:MAG: hypothetical protein HRT36_03250 [Alphaproteobacteria bacterium]|nr:hypothetical protein [Alphaproteobacteria bacterium]